MTVRGVGMGGVAAVLLLASALGPCQAAPPGEAVTLHLTESDLNGLLRGWFEEAGGGRLEGRSEQPSRGVADLRYAARFSQPTIDTAPGGLLRVRLELLEAHLDLGRVERRIAGFRASCEHTGVELAGGSSVPFELDLRLGVEAGAVRLEPVALRFFEAFSRTAQWVRPSRCRGIPLPRWLLWRLGKPRLERRIEQLDRVLLGKAEQAALRFEARGPLSRVFSIEPFGGGLPIPFHLALDRVEIGNESIELGFDDRGESTPDPRRRQGPAGASWIAVSDRIVNELLRAAFPGGGSRTVRPSGGFRRLLRSDTAFALAPGLREVELPEELAATIRFGMSPVAAFAPAGEGDDRAVVRLELRGLEIALHEPATPGSPIGTIVVESGTIAASPHLSPLGGVAFDTVSNAWRIASRGIEFDESLLAATLQELVFGELFETRYRPLRFDGAAVGSARLVPRGFGIADGDLVIELGLDAVPAVLQANSQPSRVTATTSVLPSPSRSPEAAGENIQPPVNLGQPSASPDSRRKAWSR